MRGQHRKGKVETRVVSLSRPKETSDSGIRNVSQGGLKMVALNWSYYPGPLEQGLENTLGIVRPAARCPVTAQRLLIHSFLYLLIYEIFMEYPRVGGIVLNAEDSGEGRYLASCAAAGQKHRWTLPQMAPRDTQIIPLGTP